VQVGPRGEAAAWSLRDHILSEVSVSEIRYQRRVYASEDKRRAGMDVVIVCTSH